MTTVIKLRDIKKIFDKLSEKELDQHLLYNSEHYSVSGVVTKIKKASVDLYYIGDDDPARLYTKKQLKEELEMDAEEIKKCEIEIPKGALVLEF